VFNVVMLYPLFNDAMFGSMHILEFPKGSDDSYEHKAETECQLFL
jgi:hypothetical protein